MLAFIEMEGTIGPVVSSILRRSFGARHCELVSWRQYAQSTARARPADLKHAIQFYPSLESIGGRLVVPHCGYERVCRDIRYFTLLSEPLERCAAHFQQHVRETGREARPFEQWIQDKAVRNLMTRKLAGTEHSNDAIQILETRVGCTGLAERLDESLLLIRRWANDSRLDLRYRLPKSDDDQSVRRRLLADARSRDLLVEANWEDIRLYLYAANELFPRQLAGYGSRLEADLLEFQEANHVIPPSRWQAASLAYRDALYHRAARISTALRRAA